jgi:hypothetical protein
MDSDPDLFDHVEPAAYARRTDPGTAHVAAEAIKPDVARIEMLVARAVMHNMPRGLICDDICKVTGLEWNTVSPRLKPLRAKGVLSLLWNAATEKPITRPGKSGRPQQVHYFLRWPDAR